MYAYSISHEITLTIGSHHALKQVQRNANYRSKADNAEMSVCSVRDANQRKTKDNVEAPRTATQGS